MQASTFCTAADVCTLNRRRGVDFSHFNALLQLFSQTDATNPSLNPITFFYQVLKKAVEPRSNISAKVLAEAEIKVTTCDESDLFLFPRGSRVSPAFQNFLGKRSGQYVNVHYKQSGLLDQKIG